MPRNAPVAHGDPSSPGARERILECAESLLDESGREGLTIRRLAAASGFTPPAIYGLFGDKQGLVDEIVKRAHALVLHRMGKVDNPGDPREYLRMAFREITRFGLEYRERYALLEERIPVRITPEPPFESTELPFNAPWVELAKSGDFSIEQMELMRQAFWVLLHGLVGLPKVRDDIEWRLDLAERSFDVLLSGFVAESRRGGSD